MSEQEKLDILKKMTGETDDGILSAYLFQAGQRVINTAYPYRTDVVDVPQKYAATQINIAAYLINKRGAEGETSHSENGVSRSYENADIPASMLSEVIPMVGLL